MLYEEDVVVAVCEENSVTYDEWNYSCGFHVGDD